MGQEAFLHSPPTKTTEFEMKNRCESVEEAKALYSYFVLY